MDTTIALRVTCVRTTHDMTVTVGSSTESAAIPLHDLHPATTLPPPVPGCHSIDIVSATTAHISLRYRRRDIDLDTGQRLSIEDSWQNPHSSVRHCERVTFEYFDTDHTVAVADVTPGINDTPREKALRELDKMITEGRIEYYVVKALEAASDDGRVIARPDVFRSILLEGIEEGCLTPEKSGSWNALKACAIHNDPTCFMSDRTRYLAILSAAASAGNDIARGLLDRVCTGDVYRVDIGKTCLCTLDEKIAAIYTGVKSIIDRQGRADDCHRLAANLSLQLNQYVRFHWRRVSAGSPQVITIKKALAAVASACKTGAYKPEVHDALLLDAMQILGGIDQTCADDGVSRNYAIVHP